LARHPQRRQDGQDAPAEEDRSRPLGVEDRKRLADSLAKMIGSVGNAKPLLAMTHEVWLSVLYEFAEPVLGRSRIDELVHENPDWQDRAPGYHTPIDQIMLDQMSHALCREIAERDLQAEPQERHFLVGLRARTERALGVREQTLLVRTLHRGVLLHEPSRDATQRGVGLLGRFRRETSDWVEAWAALCSAYLSGPRLLYAQHVTER
jgi:hypothetical protein